MNKVIRTARISDHAVVLPVQVDPDMMELPEIDEESSEEVGFTALGDQAEVILDDEVVNPPEPEVDVEAVVAERLQEAEARFQAEKEGAVQASLEEGRAQGLEEGRAQGLEEGRAQGDQEGYARGLAEGQAQSDDEIARFQSLITILNERWDDLFKTADHNLTELAVAIARNIVGGLVEGQETLILDAVRDCLSHVQDRSQVVIRVNPNDLDIVRTHREAWQQAFEQIESLLIEADDDIGQGGCLVETPSGDIDAQIESRLAKLKTALLEAVQGAPAELPPDLSTGEAEEEATADDALDNLNFQDGAELDPTNADPVEDIQEDVSHQMPGEGVVETEKNDAEILTDEAEESESSTRDESGQESEDISGDVEAAQVLEAPEEVGAEMVDERIEQDMMGNAEAEQALDRQDDQDLENQTSDNLESDSEQPVAESDVLDVDMSNENDLEIENAERDLDVETPDVEAESGESNESDQDDVDADEGSVQ